MEAHTRTLHTHDAQKIEGLRSQVDAQVDLAERMTSQSHEASKELALSREEIAQYREESTAALCLEQANFEKDVSRLEEATTALKAQQHEEMVDTDKHAPMPCRFWSFMPNYTNDARCERQAKEL